MLVLSSRRRRMFLLNGYPFAVTCLFSVFIIVEILKISVRMEDIHPHHHHPYHQDIRSNSVVNKLHSTNNNNNNNNNNILSSSMASMASLAASVGMSIPQHHHQHLPSVVPSNHHHPQQQQQQQQHQQQPVIISHLCAGCGQLIKDRYLLQALESYWHEDCLKCSCCGCRLGEVGSNLFTKANLILCKRDYLRWFDCLYYIGSNYMLSIFFFLNNSFWFNKRLFGATGNCAACCKPIPAFEMVMRAKSNVYHLDCFACQQCHQRWFIFYYNTISSNILHTDLYFNIFNIFIQRGYQPWTEWKCKKKQKQIAISVS